MRGKGVERPVIPEIEKAAESYETARDDRMILSEKEVETRTKLVGLMQSRNLNSYRYDGKLITIDPGQTKVKIKAIKEDED